MAGKIRLGELLVLAGWLDALKLKAALAEQQRWGGRLGRILVDMNFVSEDVLTRALSKQLGFPRATFQDMNIPASILADVPADFARSNACCPEHYDHGRKLLTVAMADPTNVPVADELRFKTGLRVEATIAGEAQVSQAIDRLYGARSGGHAVQSSEAIDLPADGDGALFAQTDAYSAAMAASGVSIDPPAAFPLSAPTSPPQPPASVVTGAPLPLQPPAHPVPPVVPGTGSHHPSTQGNPMHSTGPIDLRFPTGSLDMPAWPSNGHSPGPTSSVPPGSTPYAPPSAVGAGPTSSFIPVPAPAGPRPDGLAHRLESAQRQQHRAVQVMIDLLIEKGVFTRDEFAELLNRRGR